MKIKKFKTSQWVMAIIIISLGQLLIHYYSSQVMTGSEVINYVSFAGTIVSIILAVLAIVYSFYQSFTQQNNVDSIAREIERLKESALDIKVASKSIRKTSKLLPEIIDGLSMLPSIVSEKVTERTDDLLKAHNEEIKEHLAKVNNYDFMIRGEDDITSKLYGGLGHADVMVLHTCLAVYMLVVLKKPTDIFDVIDQKINGTKEDKFNLLAGANAVIYSFIIAGVFYFNDDEELTLIDTYDNSLQIITTLILAAQSSWHEFKGRDVENPLLVSLCELFELIPSDESEIKKALSRVKVK